ncbi:YetF domain-containing protein [Ectobacillus ponti]|uniref:DUF421 domain-containing protein n=1 Tax=Ectobacillus ponti TaxID=2961894 RepID=A0AA41XAY0_9BACI|nr:DUF421 domain-containing protein [Ectobacillus ponti]MCP8970145.1 DUF421 domain-containing protein [Ectobacillus ponti]
MSSWLHLSVELIVGYIYLFIVIKFLGKTQISQITPFDFVSALVLGNLVGDAVYDHETHVGKILFAITIWGGLIYITERLTQKFRKARGVLEGTASLLIKEGKLAWSELKKNRLDVDQLRQLLRAKDVFSMRDVQYAWLESDGTVSVKKKFLQEAPSRTDLQIPEQDECLPVLLISDGEVLEENLQHYQLDKAWLQEQLRLQNIRDAKEVCYAEWTKGQDLFIQTYE